MNERRVVVKSRSRVSSPGTVERATAQVRGELKIKGELRGSRSHEETLLERRFGTGEQAAFVRVGAGLTINTGNFESLRLDVAVTLPCLSSEVEDAYVQASEYTTNFLAEEQARWTASTQEAPVATTARRAR